MKKHTFEAKHVIVAGCAAIAMILGAMSVGSSFPSPKTPQATKAEVSSIVNSRPTSNTPSSVSGTGLSRKHTLEVRNFLQQQDTPLYTSPSVPAKSNRKSLSPIFGTSLNDPVRFIDQIVQLQQAQLADPTQEDKPPTESSTESSEDPETNPAPADNSTTQPTEDASPPTEDPAAPAPDNSPSSMTLMGGDPNTDQ